MSDYSALGAAVVGAGFIGPVHVEALRRLGIQVVGILGADPNESSQARKSLGLPRAYQSFEDVLADDNAQAVHLAVPNVFHYEMARAVLESGKHVMVEKPLAMTTEESRDLVDLASWRKLAAAVCYNIRYYPLNLHARSMVESGEIGAIYAINGSYVQDWLLYETDYNWRVLAEVAGRPRAVADIGTHWMDLIAFITGLRIKEVFADLHTVHKTRRRPIGEVKTFSGESGANLDLEPLEVDTEDNGAILFRFQGGTRGSLYVSQVTAGRKNCLRYEISGSKKALAWNSERPNQLWIGNRDRPNQEFTRDPSLLPASVRHYTNYPGGHNEGFPDTFKQCFRAFYDYILAGDFLIRPFFPTFQEGHREVVLCEAILESHRTQSWVQV